MSFIFHKKQFLNRLTNGFRCTLFTTRNTIKTRHHRSEFGATRSSEYPGKTDDSGYTGEKENIGRPFNLRIPRTRSNSRLWKMNEIYREDWFQNGATLDMLCICIVYTHTYIYNTYIRVCIYYVYICSSLTV